MTSLPDIEWIAQGASGLTYELPTQSHHVYSIGYYRADQRKHQSPASLAFVRGIHRWPVNSPHKWPVTRRIFPFDDVIMIRPYCILTKFKFCNEIYMWYFFKYWHFYPGNRMQFDTKNHRLDFHTIYRKMISCIYLIHPPSLCNLNECIK